MINAFTVLDRFMFLSGLDADAAAGYIPNCSLELSRILGRLKEGVNPEEHSADIVACAAAHVFYTYSRIRAACTESSYTVGDIKVNNGCENQVMLARGLRDDATLALHGILADDEFLFARV